MEMEELDRQILDRVYGAPEEEVFVSGDFLDLGDTYMVNQALARLTRTGDLRRIVWGIYDRPERRIVPDLPPRKLERTALVLARCRRWQIVPYEDVALALLGLSDRVPEIWRFHTDGGKAAFQLGRQWLRFLPGERRWMGLDHSSAVVLQALTAVGPQDLSRERLSAIQAALTTEQRRRLLQDAGAAEAWIFQAVEQICRD